MCSQTNGTCSDILTGLKDFVITSHWWSEDHNPCLCANMDKLQIFIELCLTALGFYQSINIVMSMLCSLFAFFRCVSFFWFVFFLNKFFIFYFILNFLLWVIFSFWVSHSFTLVRYLILKACDTQSWYLNLRWHTVCTKTSCLTNSKDKCICCIFSKMPFY